MAKWEKKSGTGISLLGRMGVEEKEIWPNWKQERDCGMEMTQRHSRGGKDCMHSRMC